MTRTAAEVDLILRRMRDDICARTGAFDSLPYLPFDLHLRQYCRLLGLEETTTRQAVFKEGARLIVPEADEERHRLERHRLWSTVVGGSGLNMGSHPARMPKGIAAELQACHDTIIRPMWPDAIILFEGTGRGRFAIQVLQEIGGFVLDYQIYGSLRRNDNLIFFQLTILDEGRNFLRQVNLNIFFADYLIPRIVTLADAARHIARFALMIDHTEQHFRAMA